VRAAAESKLSLPRRGSGGIEFGSGLVAAWASWLEERGIVWVHEAEGCALDGVQYLPDLNLPDAATFLEVKGALDGPDALKLAAMAVAAGAHGARVRPWSWRARLGRLVRRIIGGAA
jgi:hypothetical protein